MIQVKRIIILSALVASAGCGGGGSGSDCNISAGQFCPAGEYCAYVDNSCGRDGSSGSCTAVPDGCTADIAPVCTCDGLTFKNECFAGQGGQSVQSAGECA